MKKLLMSLFVLLAGVAMVAPVAIAASGCGCSDCQCEGECGKDCKCDKCDCNKEEK